MTARIALGIGASHSTLMNTHWDETTHLDRAIRFRDALDQARDAVAAAGVDTAVLLGSNHFRGFWLDLIPPFTIGVDSVIASGESGTPTGPQLTDPELARHVAEHAVERSGLDLAFSTRLQIDHGQSHAIQYLLAGLDVAVVPIVVNVFAPPLPPLARCLALGDAVADALTSFRGDRRVAVIGSGGLSHWLPWPDWRDPNGDDDEFMVEAWREGRGDWERYDGRRRQIIRAATAAINPDFDREFLSRLESGELTRYASWSTADVDRIAGNGAQEIRTWLAMAAALGHRPGRLLAYEEMPEWLTGMAVALIKEDNR